MSSASRMASEEEGAGPVGGRVVVEMDIGGAGVVCAEGATVVVVMVIGGAFAGAWGWADAGAWAGVAVGLAGAGAGAC